MKKKILLFILSLNVLFVLNGQTLPKGMNYQAVARNLKGEILPNETITLKINLVSNADQGRVEYYSEIHIAVTNELGLFSLIIGEGKVEQGAFGLIPWSKENIWMEVAIKDKTQSNFSTISNSKLLAVPYALHAGTANSLVGDNTVIRDDNQTAVPGLESRAAPGVVSTNWSVFGNAKTNTHGNIYRLNSLGTTDFIDLFLITDNQQRIKITAAGDVKTTLNFEVGKSVLLNAVSGSTINNGPFTVDKMSPTILTGTLQVNRAIKTTDTLLVSGMKPTILSGTLRVDKSTTLNDSLTVTNMKPTVLTGKLRVDKSTTLNDSLTVTNMAPTVLTGKLRVDKSTNLNDSLTVNNMAPTVLTGKLRVDKSTTLNDSLTVTNTKPTVLTGKLRVDKSTTLNDTLTVTGSKPTLLTGKLRVDSATVINDSFTVAGMNPTHLTGTLVVDKGFSSGASSSFNSTLRLHDSLMVLNMAPTILTGKLRVDKSTTLNDSLMVTGMKPTYLTGTLKVDKATTLNDTLQVANKKPTILTGSLNAKLPVDFDSTLNVDRYARFQDSVIVNGNTYMNKPLFITSKVADGGYLATFFNTDTAKGDGIKIRLNRKKAAFTIPSDKDTLSVEQQTNMRKIINCSSGLSNSERGELLGEIALEATLDGLKYLGGVAIALGNILFDAINDELNLPLDLATPVNNAIGLPKDLATPLNNALGLPLKIDSLINNKLSLPLSISTPINNALSLPIKVDEKINSLLSLPINFPNVILPKIEFPKLAVSGFVVDVPVIPTFTLPGFTVVEKFTLVPETTLLSGFELIPDITPGSFVIPAIPNFSIPAIPSIIRIPVIPTSALTIPAIPSTALTIPKIPVVDLESLGIPSIDFSDFDFWGVPTLCLDDVTASPLNNENVFIRFTDADDLKLGSIRAVSVKDWAVDYLNPVFLYGLYEAISSSVVDKKHALYHFQIEGKKALRAYAAIGVEYSSGNGDYAEWLVRSNPAESINKGDIVGVIGGKITKDLKDAEQVMAVSHNPIVLGNVPDDGKVAYGNNIAFMGQIPVKILGPAVSGDYIVGNLNTPGYGRAIKPADMTIQDFKFAVGRAWESNEAGGPKLVNTVIGVHNGDYIKILKKFEEKVEKTENRLQSLEQKVEALLQKSNH